MTGEPLRHPPLAEAQTFFWELYQEVSDGPFSDNQKTNSKIHDVNACLQALVHEGVMYEDGSQEAQYEALVEVALLSQTTPKPDESFVHIGPNRSFKCTIRFANEGFALPSYNDMLRWTGSFELENGSQFSVSLTAANNRVSQQLEGAIYPEREYSRGLVVIANRFAMLFNLNTLIIRNY